MKKLLIMASLFWPQKNSGGPPVSIMNLVRLLKGYFDIYIISKNHEINDDKPLYGIITGWNDFDFGKVYYTAKGKHRFNDIIKIIDEVTPDVIYQNSFFSLDDLIPVLVYKKKHKNIRVIVAPRGEFYPERLEIGKIKKLTYGKLIRYSGLLKDIYFQGTSMEECKQEKDFLRIPSSYIVSLQNISIVDSGLHRRKEKKSNELKMVYVARIHPTKNILNAIRWLRGLKGNIQYDIYGSVEDEAYWQQCLEEIERLPRNITVRYMGVLDHNQVASTIAKYHVYYMPTTGENFGHSIVEAMLMGKPVVISDQTPWTDVNGNGGYAISLTDEETFISSISELIDMCSEKYVDLSEQIEKYIKGKLNVDEIVRQYIAVFNGE